VLKVTSEGAAAAEGHGHTHGHGGGAADDHGHDEPTGATSASGLVRLPDGSVSVPKLSQWRMESRTVLAPLTQAAASVELNGRAVLNPDTGGHVQAVHGGRMTARLLYGEAMEHEHAHTHDGSHYDHVHDPMPVGPQSHPHRHETPCVNLPPF
jgi:hypothetical protein